MRPTLNTYRTNLPFLRKLASVATSQVRIFVYLIPIMAGVAPEVFGPKVLGSRLWVFYSKAASLKNFRLPEKKVNW